MWFLLALSSAVFWGLAYALSGNVLQKFKISPAFLLLMQNLLTTPVYLYICFHFFDIGTGFTALEDLSTLFFVLIFALTVSLGNLCVLASIKAKNATMANLVEISFPLFTLLFAFLLFGETHLNFYGLLGAGLIFSGVGLLVVKGEGGA